MSLTLAIIPARAGSKRLPGKNTKLLGGKPLVCWAMDAALASKEIDLVVVSSDDDTVLALAAERKGLIALKRPVHLASDTALAIDFVRHALEHLEKKSAHDEVKYETVVIVQPTSPFTLPADIDGTVKLLDESGADSAVSVMQLDHAIHPLKLKILQEDAQLLPFYEDEGDKMAAHELDELYARNGSVYATRRDVVESGSLLGRDSRGYKMPRERSLDINDATDFAFAEFLLSQQGLG